MRTLALSLVLVAVPAHGGARAEEPEPAPDPAAGEDEAQLQELERILAETAKASEPTCENAPPPVTFRRKGIEQPVVVSLLDCRGEPSSEALRELSALAQPPVPDGAPLQLNPGLLVRLQRLADQFPGHAFDVVSGIRPGARSGSRHRRGDALDVHVDGVDDLAVAELARGLEATGVGYYPNSTFVHLDVREQSFSWVDRSRPGEKPLYGPWPGSESESESHDEAESGAEAAAAIVATLEPGAEAPAVPQAEPVAEPEPAADPELQAIADRALLVMNDALSINDAPSSVPASPPEPETTTL